MDALPWVPAGCRRLLDVGCNVGEFLADMHAARPAVALAGCDVNAGALRAAAATVPFADFRAAGAGHLPFDDAAFDCVTCIETLEHVPPADWERSLQEMHRVLTPGGLAILRTPHAGWFAWLDTNNVRFRLPGLYRLLVGKGRRDAGFAAGSRAVEWHHHFTRGELLALAGSGWSVEATRYGGLIVFPLGDFVRWPFYRRGRGGHPVERWATRAMSADYAIDYGRASYGILLVLAKT